jgi:hypothetical protein
LMAMISHPWRFTYIKARPPLLPFFPSEEDDIASLISHLKSKIVNKLGALMHLPITQ